MSVENYFKKLIKEELDDRNVGVGEQSPEDSLVNNLGNPEAEDEAFKNNLDDDTDPSQFDVNPVSFKKITEENIQKARDWASKFEEMADYINNEGDESESFNQFINRVDREGSPFQGIVRSQSKRVTRISEELMALVEHLNSNIIGSERKMKQLMQQFPNLER
jgi:hypothetical protein